MQIFAVWLYLNYSRCGNFRTDYLYTGNSIDIIMGFFKCIRNQICSSSCRNTNFAKIRNVCEYFHTAKCPTVTVSSDNSRGFLCYVLQTLVLHILYQNMPHVFLIYWSIGKILFQIINFKISSILYRNGRPHFEINSGFHGLAMLAIHHEDSFALQIHRISGLHYASSISFVWTRFHLIT